MQCDVGCNYMNAFYSKIYYINNYAKPKFKHKPKTKPIDIPKTTFFSLRSLFSDCNTIMADM